MNRKRDRFRLYLILDLVLLRNQKVADAPRGDKQSLFSHWEGQRFKRRCLPTLLAIFLGSVKATVLDVRGLWLMKRREARERWVLGFVAVGECGCDGDEEGPLGLLPLTVVVDGG